MASSVKRKTTAKKGKKMSPKKNTRHRLPSIPLLEPAAADFTHRITSSMMYNKLHIEDLADVSDERISILSIVKSMEGQVETVFKLKEVLEVELQETQDKLAEMMEERTELEMRVESLQVRAAMVEELREDISCLEQERDKIDDMLSTVQPQLEKSLAEGESFSEQLFSARETIKEIENERMTQENHISTLKDTITDAGHLREELTDATKANQNLRGQVYLVTRRLETSEAAKAAAERELDDSNRTSRGLQEELNRLREKFATIDSRLTDVRIQFEDQQADNKELMEVNSRLENSVKTLSIDYEASRNELDAFKNIMRDIRSEAAQTSGRVRRRYFKPKDMTVRSKNN